MKTTVFLVMFFVAMNLQAKEYVVTGSANYTDAKEIYPGASNASRVLWDSMCVLAKKRAIQKARYTCYKKGLNIVAAQFKNNGNCRGHIFSVGYSASLNFACSK